MFKKKAQPEVEREGFVSSRTQLPKKKRLTPPKGTSSTSLSSLANSGVWRPNASINNLEQEKKKEVDKEIKEKDRRRRRRVRVRITLRLVVLVAIGIGLFLLLGASSRRVHLNLDNGAGTAYEDDLKSSLSSDLNGGLMGYIRPAFLRYRHIESQLIEQRDEIDSAKLHFNILRMRTEAEVKTNIPLVRWVGADGIPSYVNQHGQVFEPPTSFVEQFKPLEISGSGLGSEPGSKVLASSDKLAWAVGVIPVLREQGIDPVKVNIDGQSYKSVEVLINGVDTRLIFSIDEDVTRSGIAAARAVKFIQKGGAEALKGVGYIDVRTPERVLYK